MKYRLRVSNAFERELRRLKQVDRERTWGIIQQIQEAPYSHKALIRKFRGTISARLGNLRIIYTVNEREKRVILLHVGYRERVYER